MFQSNYRMNEKGSVTLIMTVLILFSLSLISVFSARIGVIEHRITANHYRAKQAYEAAQAGIAASLTQIDRNQIQTAIDGGGSATNCGKADGLSGSLTQQHNNELLSTYAITCTAIGAGDPLKQIQLSVSSSASGSNSSQNFQQVIEFQPILANVPPAALTARTTIDGLDLIANNSNPTDHVAIWAGDVISNKSTIITDNPNGVAESDSSLLNLNSSDFFANFFGSSMTSVKARATVVKCNGPGGGTCRDTSSQITALAGDRGDIVWLTSRLHLKGPITIGSESKPVILIIDNPANNKFELNDAQVFIHGAVYVNGNWDNKNGTGTIYGLVIVNGSFSKGGGLTIDYTAKNTVTNIEAIGAYYQIAGTWRDF
ncbi:MAG: pilus assembly PilX N-terminal domain-containing protein [Gammaproteobacteria bacterium]|nr:pilus assembly PilX N-terminal domain-containing protein [Gammaproteobacteria bacterium]MDH5730137.1 pilus assembly PilX N-terminal domain-containing protein [Gammaproteobacteria bacterium]